MSTFGAVAYEELLGSWQRSGEDDLAALATSFHGGRFDGLGALLETDGALVVYRSLLYHSSRHIVSRKPHFKARGNARLFRCFAAPEHNTLYWHIKVSIANLLLQSTFFFYHDWTHHPGIGKIKTGCRRRNAHPNPSSTLQLRRCLCPQQRARAGVTSSLGSPIPLLNRHKTNDFIIVISCG